MSVVHDSAFSHPQATHRDHQRESLVRPSSEPSQHAPISPGNHRNVGGTREFDECRNHAEIRYCLIGRGAIAMTPSKSEPTSRPATRRTHAPGDLIASADHSQRPEEPVGPPCIVRSDAHAGRSYAQASVAGIFAARTMASLVPLISRGFTRSLAVPSGPCLAQNKPFDSSLRQATYFSHQFMPSRTGVTIIAWPPGNRPAVLCGASAESNEQHGPARRARR